MTNVNLYHLVTTCTGIQQRTVPIMSTHMHYYIVLLNCPYLFFFLTTRKASSIFSSRVQTLNNFSWRYFWTWIGNVVVEKWKCLGVSVHPTRSGIFSSALPVLNTLCSLTNTMVAIDKTEVSIFWIPEPEAHTTLVHLSLKYYINICTYLL